MSLATIEKVIKPHARPTHIRLVRGDEGLPPGTVLGPMPRHLAALYVDRGAAEYIEGGPAAKRIGSAPRNKSL